MRGANTVIGLAGLFLFTSNAHINAQSVQAQSADASDWQAAAGGNKSFDVASVKPGSTLGRRSIFPLDEGNAYVPGGRLSASFPLWFYIRFAYKIAAGDQERADAVAPLPEWVDRDLFVIEARAEGGPTKDQMRLMMQSLLADRFKLRVHFETKEIPVFALTLVKPGTLGRKLLPHEQGPPCPDAFTPSSVAPSGGSPPKEVFPSNCNTQEARVRDGVYEAAGRNSAMPSLATVIYVLGSRAGELDKPVVDRTGLTGKFDYTIVYTPNENGSSRSPDQKALPPDPQGIPFLDAVRQQLGLRLESFKGPIRRIVIDHIEKPSPN
jgi:bla regulator protein blaR1